MNKHPLGNANSGLRRPPSAKSLAKKRKREHEFFEQRTDAKAQASRLQALEVASAVVAAQRSVSTQEQRRQELQLNHLGAQIQSLLDKSAPSIQQAVYQ